jgi:hypothetical protein
MKLKKRILKAMAVRTMTRARAAGNDAARRVIVAADTALVQAGRAAQRRQRTRAVKKAFNVAGKAAMIAGTAAAAVMAVRAVRARKAAT